MGEGRLEFQAKSGSSGSCRLFLHFLGKIAVQEMSGKTPGSPRHPSSRHPWPSDKLSLELSRKVVLASENSLFEDKIVPQIVPGTPSW